MTYKPIAFLLLAALCLAMLPAGAAVALDVGDTIVGNVFVTSFDGWTDTYTGSATAKPNWGVLLTDGETLSESCNTILGADGAPLGQCDVFNMVNTSYTTPAEYTITAKVGSRDDDGFGLIFGYQDEGNYYRISCRAQDADSFGYPRGVSLEKVTTVSGTTTYEVLHQNTTIRSSIPALTSSKAGVLYDLAVTVAGDKVTVTGNFAGGEMATYIDAVQDTALPDRAAGHYGVHSWAQEARYASGTSTAYLKYKQHGTLVQSVAVTSETFSKTTSFPDAVPIAWRPIEMINAKGVGLYGLNTDSTPVYEGDDYGNFRNDFRNGTILDDSNGFEWATSTKPNIDFVGPAVVVDEPGNASWTDYEMTVRLTARDDEGPGMLVRVQDAKTFYRINFAKQSMGSGASRAPRGMSIQKCDGRAGGTPTWTELFRDDQVDPTFVYKDDNDTGGPVPFDVRVRVIGNTITVQVVDDPDGAATVINYAPVVDSTDPILSGSVGFTNWGGGDADNGIIYSPYGGVAGTPLLVCIPEPSTLALLALLAVGWLGRRR